MPIIINIDAAMLACPKPKAIFSTCHNDGQPCCENKKNSKATNTVLMIRSPKINLSIFISFKVKVYKKELRNRNS